MSRAKDIGDALTESILSSDAIGIATEYAEIAIDAVLEEGVLRDLPIVSTIRALAKVGANIRDRLLARKILQYLNGLHELAEAERIEMVQRIDSDPSFQQKLGLHLIELLDRIDSGKKPAMISKVFVAYARGEIELLMLRRLNDAVEILPEYEIAQVRPFFELDPEDRPESGRQAERNPTTQALTRAGLLTPLSAYGMFAYEPNEVCEAFVSLELDRV